MEPLSATILILVVTNRNITLAVDSRKTILTQNDVSAKGVMDKIYRTNDYYYAISGLDSSDDKTFSIHALIHDVLHYCEDFDLAARRLALDLAHALKSFFTKMKEESVDFFRKFQSYSASGGELVVIKNVGTLPTAYLLDYRIVDGVSIKIIVNTWKTDSGKIKEQDICFWRAVGNTSFLNEYRYSEKDIASDPVLFAKQILWEGIKRYPVFVGEPINILQLNESGAQWIERSTTAPNRV